MSLASPLINLIPAPPLAITQVVKTINNKAIVGVFNQVFLQAIKDGDLDFLQGQWILIEVTDINLSFNLGFNGQRLMQANQNEEFALTISANSCHFLDLISKQKDPDTLFFQRKIKMQGSTELGLHVKNFLDAFETDTHWLSAGMDKVLKKSYPILNKLLCSKL